MTIIGIEGIDGVGKTTLTQDLARTLSSRLVPLPARPPAVDRKSTRLNSSHLR